MNPNDVLYFLYSYRLYPVPKDVPHLFTYFTRQRLLFTRSTASAIAGIVTALCERHPEEYFLWRPDFLPIIQQSVAIEKSVQAKLSPLWAEFLMNRWLILGTDKAAWELLKLCHYAPTDAQKRAAQDACDAICRSIDSKPIRNSQGKLIGKAAFEDMRLQMVRLANDFRALTHQQRQLPFDLIPFSQESVAAQLEQLAAGLPVPVPAVPLIQ